MTPLIFQKTVVLPRPTDDDRRAFDERVSSAIGLAPLLIPLSLLRRIPRVPASDAPLTCTIARTGNTFRLVDLGRQRSFSVALDIGTTNLVALLCDNLTGDDVILRSEENPQISYGSDILTRMHHVLTGKGEELSRALLRGVNGLVARLCGDAGIDPLEVHGLAVAGNTVMTHFFLGLDSSTIPVAPFTPVVRTPGFVTAAEAGVNLCPEAPVFVFPNAGSYVGGDITAGIIATGMDRAERVALLVDVGTNAEVVIGNRDWMIVGAGEAGPALEEGISRAGKRARRGIVYDVEIRNGHLVCRTFDNAPPEGICGSGMVSLLYEMHRTGLIDQTGVLAESGFVETRDGERRFILSGSGPDALAITQSEIQNFLRSKAAMFTLLLTLTRSLGLSFRDISAVHVSGALGTGIDVRKAVGIGMLPDWPTEIVHGRGNTSLAGCRKLLSDASVATQAEALIGRITYKHMHDDPEFMKEFLGAVFIPHTDPGLLTVR